MIRTCDTPEIRDARPGERATVESRESRPRVAVEQHLPRVAVEQYLSGPVIGWAAPGCWPPAPHTGATCRHCTAVQCSVQLYSCHTSNIITSSDRQSVSNSGSSQTLVTKCREILSPVKNWYLIEIRIVAVNDIDEEFYLWISWQWQSSWHCKYLLTWKKS